MKHTIEIQITCPEFLMTQNTQIIFIELENILVLALQGLWEQIVNHTWNFTKETTHILLLDH